MDRCRRRKLIKVSNKCIAVRKVATPLRELTCRMGSHSVTCHPAEATFPPDVWWTGWVPVGEWFFWYRRTLVILDKGPLNGYVCVCLCLDCRLADGTTGPVQQWRHSNTLACGWLEQRSVEYARCVVDAGRYRRRAVQRRTVTVSYRTPRRTEQHHHTHTHTHPFNGPLSGTTPVSRYPKGKNNLGFTEARDSEWQWHQLGHMQVCTSLQTNNHASTPPLSFLQAGCPSCRPNNTMRVCGK